MMIRLFRSADIPALIAWSQTPAELIQWGGPKRRFPLDEAQLAACLAETHGPCPTRWMWAADRDGTLAATASVLMDWDQGVALLSMVGVAPHAQGQGLAAPFTAQVVASVFAEPAFERLELNVYTFNAAAIRTYEALGFVCEGIRRSLAKVEKERWDAAHYAMLRAGYVDHIRRGGAGVAAVADPG